MRRQEGRSVARRNAEWSPRLSGLRSLSIVRSQDWRGRPLGWRQSTGRRSLDARDSPPVGKSCHWSNRSCVAVPSSGVARGGQGGPNGRGIKRCFCLTSDVCLSDVCLTSVCLSVAHIGRNARTERPRKTKIDTEVAHVTRDSDTTFKIKRSKVKVPRPLWLVVLAGQHGHTVMVTYPYAYMTYIVSPLAGLGGGISWRPPAYSLFYLQHSYCTLNCTQSFNGGETPWMSYDATNPPIWRP